MAAKVVVVDSGEIELESEREVLAWIGLIFEIVA